MTVNIKVYDSYKSGEVLKTIVRKGNGVHDMQAETAR